MRAWLGIGLGLLGACSSSLELVAPPPEVTPDGRTDADGDGFSPVVQGGEDCDDANPAVHPLAAEVCGDGLDNNCDGQVDDRGEGGLLRYEDLDADGFGDPESPVLVCPGRLGEGPVEDGSDCDDSDPLVNPAVPRDLCDLADDDCDGRIDEDEPILLDGVPRATLLQALQEAAASGGPSEVQVCAADAPYRLEGVTISTTDALTIAGVGNADRPVVIEVDGEARLRTSGDADLTLRNLVFEPSPGIVESQEPLVEVQGDLTLAIEGCTFQDLPRPAVQAGGSFGFFAQPVVVRIHDSRFLGCGTELEHGGALRLLFEFDARIEATSFAHNRALSGGGAFVTSVFDEQSALELVDSDFNANWAAEEGGGLRANLVDITMDNTAFLDNEALEGGGLFVSGGSVHAEGNSRVTGNRARDKGGGLSVVGQPREISGLSIRNNVALEGGGLYVDAITRIRDFELLGNEAEGLGGGLLFEGSALALCDGTIEANVAQWLQPATGIALEGSAGGVFANGRSGWVLHAENVTWGEGALDNVPTDLAYQNDLARLVTQPRVFGSEATFPSGAAASSTPGCDP